MPRKRTGLPSERLDALRARVGDPAARPDGWATATAALRAVKIDKRSQTQPEQMAALYRAGVADLAESEAALSAAIDELRDQAHLPSRAALAAEAVAAAAEAAAEAAVKLAEEERTALQVRENERSHLERSPYEGDAVVANVASHGLWIFAQVQTVHREGGRVVGATVEDQDESGGRKIRVEPHNVCALPSDDHEFRFAARAYGRVGARVFAMYPETTSFYPATVRQANVAVKDKERRQVPAFMLEFDGEDLVPPPVYPVPVRYVTSVPDHYRPDG